ncbi:MAG: helix-turn-helix domain-containing protein [Ignavibacteriaceae bacterium]
MKRKELIDLIENGETLNCEYKLHFSSYKKMAKEIIAFANTSGGTLIIGVDDDRRIVGVESEKAETELILDTLNNYCVPTIHVEFQYFDINNKEIVVVLIPESKNKPHRIQDYKDELDIRTAQVYVRINDKSVPASKEMIRVLRSGSSGTSLKKYSIGSIEKSVFKFLEKNETITLKDLSQIANISQRRASRSLVNLVRADLLLIHTNDNGEDYFTGRKSDP